MNEFEKRKCLELTNKMLRKDLCRLFKEKVDPERDGAPDYYTIIKHPMDLTTIRKKLNANEYRSIDQWAGDVNLIWKNAKIYNIEGSIIHFIAKELEEWFARKLIQLPRNKDEEWMLQLRKSSTALMRLASHPPSSIVPMSNLVFDTLISDTLPFTILPKEVKKEQNDDVQIIERVSVKNEQEYKNEDKTDDGDDAPYAEFSDDKSATDDQTDL